MTRGLEPLLADELRDLGLASVQTLPGAVRVHCPEGDRVEQGMRCCLWSRLAEQVILPIGVVRVQDPMDVRGDVRRMRLLDWFTPDHTFAIDATVRARFGPAPHALALQVKDAIADTLRDRYGRRPWVDTRDPHVPVSAHLEDNELTVGLKLQGAPLHRRGYRLRGGPASVRETIAAAMLRFSGWTGEVPLHDPMCGAGTIVIEAAMLASRTAPGLRREFAFERWPRFPELQPTWERLREHAEDTRLRTIDVPILASDIDERAVRATERDAWAGGIQHMLTVFEAPITALQPLSPPGLIVTNPPWGERLAEGDVEAARELHRELGNAVKTCPGHTLILLSTKAASAGAVPMRPDRVLPFRNGPISVQFASYSVLSAASASPTSASPADASLSAAATSAAATSAPAPATSGRDVAVTPVIAPVSPASAPATSGRDVAVTPVIAADDASASPSPAPATSGRDVAVTPVIAPVSPSPAPATSGRDIAVTPVIAADDASASPASAPATSGRDIAVTPVIAPASPSPAPATSGRDIAVTPVIAADAAADQAERDDDAPEDSPDQDWDALADWLDD